MRSLAMILIIAMATMVAGACAPIPPYLPEGYQQDNSAIWKEVLQKREDQRKELRKKVEKLNKEEGKKVKVITRNRRNTKLIKSAVQKALLKAGYEVRSNKADIYFQVVKVNISRGNRLEETRWYQHFYKNYYGRNCYYDGHNGRRGGDPRHEVNWTSVELVIKKTCPNGHVYAVGNGRGSSITEMQDQLDCPRYQWNSSEEESLFSATYEGAMKALLNF